MYRDDDHALLARAVAAYDELEPEDLAGEIPPTSELGAEELQRRAERMEQKARRTRLLRRSNTPAAPAPPVATSPRDELAEAWDAHRKAYRDWCDAKREVETNAVALQARARADKRAFSLDELIGSPRAVSGDAKAARVRVATALLEIRARAMRAALETLRHPGGARGARARSTLPSATLQTPPSLSWWHFVLPYRRYEIHTSLSVSEASETLRLLGQIREIEGIETEHGFKLVRYPARRNRISAVTFARVTSAPHGATIRVHMRPALVDIPNLVFGYVLVGIVLALAVTAPHTDRSLYALFFAGVLSVILFMAFGAEASWMAHRVHAPFPAPGEPTR